jgi:AcrR family transcriptional regulator
MHDVRMSTRRVRGADARARILAASERLLRSSAYRELSVDAVMTEAGLSRTIFYRHFDTLAGVVAALLADIEAELFPILEEAPMEDVLRAAVAMYVEHGPFLLAVQAATFHDGSIEATFRALVERFDTHMAGQMRAAMDEGRVAPGDPADLARAMNRFNNAYLLDTFGRAPRADADTALSTLLAVWVPLTSHASSS